MKLIVENRYGRTCVECGDILFQTCRKRKSLFFDAYKQRGGSQTLLINISRRSNLLTVYSINYFIHINSYDFYNAAETVKKIISAVEKNFVPGDKLKVQETIKIVNYETSHGEYIEQKNKRT